MSINLYIDDSGSRLPDKHPQEPRDDGMDAFGLGGIIFDDSDSDEILEAYTNFCGQFDIDYPLHSTAIRCRKGRWGWLNHSDRSEEFYEKLSELMTSAPFKIIACIASRPGYNCRYEQIYGEARWKLCRSTYAILIERATKYALNLDEKLRIYIEESGKTEDRKIRSYHEELRTQGTYFDPNNSSIYSPLSADEFCRHTLKNPKFVKKKNPYAQLADLVLYPVIKGKYEDSYPPYTQLRDSGQIIDSHLTSNEQPEMGVKYYCFDS